VDGIAAITAIILLVDLLGGVAVGMFGSASVASVLEDYGYSLTGAAPGTLRDGARVIHGVRVRGSGFVTSALRGAGGSDDTGGKDVPQDNSNHDAHGQEPDL
jgi:hypothetical protein